MKPKITLIVAALFALVFASCGVDYEKTKSGIVYKLYPGDSKDSTAKKGNVVKFNFIRKINDSLLYSSYGKMPGFQAWTDDPGISYSPLEVLFMMKEGDSAEVIEMADTLLNKGLQQQIPFAKKGDRLKTYIKVTKIFRSDSLAQLDYNAEMTKDRPRQEQEMKEMQEKEMAKMKEMREKEIADLRKSGELAKQEKEVEAYLAAKNITATKAPGGTYVLVKEKGTGEPATAGKIVTVKYDGRLLRNDSSFQASSYVFPLGRGEVVPGWDDGLTLFNEGGKGTLFIPGYLAYGSRPGPGGKPHEALIFEVEMSNVSNTQEEAQMEKRRADSIDAAKAGKKSN